MKSTFGRFCAVACGLGLAAAAWAQTPLTNVVQVTEGAQSGHAPKVALDDAGNFVVVWHSYTGDGSGRAVFGRRFNAAGIPQGASFQVNNTTTGEQRDPLVAMAPNGEFAVLWSSILPGGLPQTFVRAFDNLGSPVAGEIAVNTDPARATGSVSLSVDRSGEFLVAWHEFGGAPGTPTDVLARRFDVTGSALGPPFRVSNAPATISQAWPFAAKEPGGAFVVSWYGPIENHNVTKGRRFAPDGTPLGDDVELSGAPAAPDDIVVDPSGNYLFLNSGSGYSTAGRYFDSALTPREPGFVLGSNTSYPVYEYGFDWAGGPDGTFVVVGSKCNYDSEGEDCDDAWVHGRRVNRTGTDLRSDFIVGDAYGAYIFSGSSLPKVASNQQGDFVVVWSGSGRVQARRFGWETASGTLSGTVVDGATGLPIAGATVSTTSGYKGGTDAAGRYTIHIAPGNHAATAMAFGYANSAPASVLVSLGAISMRDFALAGVPVLSFVDAAVDDSAGNANGVADFNERFELRVELQNAGAAPASGISATLTTATPQVQLLQAASPWPDLAAGASATNLLAFAVKTSPTFVSGTRITFTLSVATAEGPFTVPFIVQTGQTGRDVFDSTGPARIGGGQRVAPDYIAIPVSGMSGLIANVQLRVHMTSETGIGKGLSLDPPFSGVPDVGLVGDNFPGGTLGTDCPASANDTTFAEDAERTLSDGTPPFVGKYLANFSSLKNKPPNGVWKLKASRFGAISVIQCARLIINTYEAHSGRAEEVAVAGVVRDAATGGPISGATVTTDTGFHSVTDGEGRYRLDVSPGLHKLEAAAPGYSPGRASATASVGATVAADFSLTPLVVSVASTAIDDTGPGGNGNGTVDLDEAFRLFVTVSNGGVDATGVSAALSATSPGVVIARGRSAYPPIPAGATGANITPFEVRTTPGFRAGEPLVLSLTLQTAQGPVAVPFSLPTGTPLGAPLSFSATGPLFFQDGSVDMPIAVTGLSAPIAKLEVSVHISHGEPKDLDLLLLPPGNQQATKLAAQASGASAPNFGTDCPADDNDTTFADDGSTDFSYLTVFPAVGRFRPPDPLALFTGVVPSAANGSWRVRINPGSWPNRLGSFDCARLKIDTFAVAGADTGDLIFRDGFEDYSLAAWPLASTDGGDLSVDWQAALGSSGVGLKAVVNDRNGLWVRHDAPSPEPRYRARFYFDPNGFDPGEANGARRAQVFLAFNGATGRRLVQIVLRRIDGAYAIKADVRLDDETLASTAFFPIADAPHFVELDWQKATGDGANDGAFELLVDGVSAGRLSGLDNDTRGIDYVRLGAQTLKQGATGTLYFDEFEARRAIPVGPMP